MTLTLRTKLIWGNVIASQLAIGLFALLLVNLVPELSQSLTLGPVLTCMLLAGALVWLLTRWLTQGLSTSLKALEVGLLNIKDNDFSVNIPESGDSQLKALSRLFNESAAVLRRERQYIYQRELLLDKVIQSSPNVMVLLDDRQRIIYANDAARHLFAKGARIEGGMLEELLSGVSEELASAVINPKGGLFTLASLDEGGEDETWHLSRGRFLLNGQYHHLILLKQMTRELNRQEVAVWKKVIRIISHELNNSVAPIASMVNSGRKLTAPLDDPKLKLIFDTIEDRTTHLSQFIFNYARFAKLPLPKRSEVDWHKLVAQLAEHFGFTLVGELPQRCGYFDLIQLEQVLLNLLKNAHESGSKEEAITLSVNEQHLADGSDGVNIEIADEGSGMSPEVLTQALLPFYSTKHSGTGLGLALCREIIEAHDGRISLHNREQKGLVVRIWLPYDLTQSQA
ncbi:MULTISPECIES: sensor histidine kinase [Shewanella]|uniref:histidine kinase n=1 Tax=Shewanella marisflavi TaxID=260364 RepID=A0ABX5WL06_9GAMM|nr:MULTISPECIES: ATP-binding protein [Shewanella]QDF74290.1 PAS domain-containing protein [Shewanella marisflavi]